MNRHTTRVTVRYGETDQMGFVHHRVYLLYFEHGRTSMMKALGCPYGQMEKDGAFLPVTEVGLKFKAPARFEDEIEIATTVQSVTAARVIFAYEVRKVVDDTLLCEGFTVLGSIGANGVAKRLPAGLVETLKGELA